MKQSSWMTGLFFGCFLLMILAITPGCSDSESVAPDTPIIALSETSLSFTSFAGSLPVSPARQILVSNAGAGTLTFSVSTASSWIDIGVVTDTSFFMAVRSETLATGQYIDSILVSGDRASNSPKALVVTLTVSEQLAASPDSVFFEAVSGGTVPNAQYINLAPIGGVDIDFEAASTASWVAITNGSGTTPDSFSVGVDLSGLGGGIYEEDITVTSDDIPGMSVEIPVRLALSSWLKRYPFDSVIAVGFALRGTTFIDNLNGWVVGFLPGLVESEGAIFITDDGGETWTLSGDRPPGRYEGIAFVDANHGWVTGDSGRLEESFNGGATWFPVNGLPADSTVNLIDVYFSGLDSGWIAGTGGTIMATTDGGSSWTLQSTPLSNDVYDLWFTDALTGWACGNTGVILHTSNGGATWTQQTSGLTADLRGVCFTDASNGWVVGGNGTLLHTTNGGGSWEMQSTDATQTLLDVRFVSTNRGWIIGQGGMIFRTVDGGQTWERQLSGTGAALFSMYFMSDDIGIVVGNQGTILKTISGGF